uniref:Uncharacterized protein n=1 Tax=Timema bartmani TaxID=61472 RepID=A0A7R9HWE9_9NEOP|nr:unnamed protein product [Timema bartmani]
MRDAISAEERLTATFRSLKPPPSGSGSKSKKTYYLADHLSFLIPFMKGNSTSGNFTAPSTGESVSGYVDSVQNYTQDTDENGELGESKDIITPAPGTADDEPPNDESSQLIGIPPPQKKFKLESWHPKTSNNDADIAFTEWETELNFSEKKYQHSTLWCARYDRHPLHLSVKEGNEVKVKRQCLVLSALKNNIDTKNFFEEFSSNPNIQDADGNNALHLAILNDSFDCLKEIISGPRTNWLENAVNQFNFEGFAPIHLAVKIGHIETITALLGAGADINLKDVKSGRNPLFHAVEMDDTEMVSTLVKAGADSLEPNFAGQSAFQAAKEVPSKNKQMISHMITIEGIKQAESRNKVIKKQGRGTESGLHKPSMKKMKKEKKKRVSKKMSQKLIKSVATKTGLSVQAELNTVLEFEDE